MLFSVFSYYIIDRSINNQTGAACNKGKHDIEKITFYLELNALKSLEILLSDVIRGRTVDCSQIMRVLKSIIGNKTVRRVSNQ